MTVYLEHFGLREAPFRITPHTEFFFSGANRGETLEALMYAITSGEGLVKVTGEVGTGKTMLCRVLMERLPDTVETVYLAVPNLTRNEILVAIAAELGLADTSGVATQLLRRLQERLVEVHGEGRRVVALIDEAHAMPDETLEELRLLTNLETPRSKLLQLVLFGQPELDERLSQASMRQLRERITHAFTLAPMPATDIAAYVNFRLRAAGYKGPDLFGPEVLGLISEASEGLTRRVNIYADKTLLAAFAAGTHTLTADHARAAIADTQVTPPPPRSRGTRRALAWGAVGLAAGVALGVVLPERVRSGGESLPPKPADPAPTAPAEATTPSPPSAPVPAPALSPPATPKANPTPPAPSPPTVPAPKPAPQTSNQAPPPATEAPKPTSAPVAAQPVTPSPAIVKPASPPDRGPTNLFEARQRAGADMLRSGSRTTWVIQLVTTDADREPDVDAFLQTTSKSMPVDSLYAFAWKRGNRQGLAVFNGPYESRQAAEAARAALPARERSLDPQLRRLGSLQDEAVALTQ